MNLYDGFYPFPWRTRLEAIWTRRGSFNSQGEWMYGVNLPFLIDAGSHHLGQFAFPG